jgi:uncharacterized protein YjbJ (UPF0337 family)
MRLSVAFRLTRTELWHIPLCALSHRLRVVCRTSLSTVTSEIGEGMLRVISGMGTEGVRMNKAQVKGRVEQVKGKIKKVTGDIVGNKTLEQKGRVQEIVGKVEASLGDLKDDLKNGS